MWVRYDGALKLNIYKQERYYMTFRLLLLPSLSAFKAQMADSKQRHVFSNSFKDITYDPCS